MVRSTNILEIFTASELSLTTPFLYTDGVIYVWKLSEGEARQVQGMMDSNAPIIEKKEEWNVVTTLNRYASLLPFFMIISTISPYYTLVIDPISLTEAELTTFTLWIGLQTLHSL